MIFRRRSGRRGRSGGGANRPKSMLALVETAYDSRHAKPVETTTFQRNSVQNGAKENGDLFEFQAHEIARVGWRAWRNLNSNSGFFSADGITPDTWSNVVNDGTRTFLASTVRSNHTAIAVSVTAERNYISKSFTVEIGNEYRLHYDIEDIDGLTGASGITSVIAGATMPQIQGENVEVGRVTSDVFTATGTTLTVRLGAGVSNIITGSMTFSAFMLEDVSGQSNQNPNEYAARDTAIGSELVTNGTFDTDSDWNKGTGWTIGSGIATLAVQGSGSEIWQAVDLTPGKAYSVTFTVSNFASGSIFPRFIGGSTVTGTSRTADGTYTETLVADTGNLSLRFFGPTGSAMSIDDVSLKEATTGLGFSPRENGNSVTSNVVTEADGALLRPQITKFIRTDKGTARFKVWAVRAPRKDSTSYVLSNKIILATDTVIPRSATGNTHWYEVKVAGTSAASPPDFSAATTIGDEVVDGTVTWENKGRYSIAGFLGEDTSDNDALQSEDFSTTWTPASATVITNQSSAPDGKTTMDKIHPTTTGTFRDVGQQITRVSGKHTVTVFAKAGEFNWLFFRNFANSGLGAHFDLTNGVVGTVQAGFAAKISELPGGIFRCEMTNTSDVADPWITVGLSDADNTSTATTNGTDGLFIWGGQNEAGSFATSYIKTTTTSAQRISTNTWPQYPISNHLDARGTVLLDFVPQVNGTDMAALTNFGLVSLTNLTAKSVLYHRNTSIKTEDSAPNQTATLITFFAGVSVQGISAWSTPEDEIATRAFSDNADAEDTEAYSDSFTINDEIMMAVDQENPTLMLNLVYVQGFANAASRLAYKGFD